MNDLRYFLENSLASIERDNISTDSVWDHSYHSSALVTLRILLNGVADNVEEH